MSRPELSTGASATATTLVADADLADKVALDPADIFPAVYATSRMIALMEIAAARVLTSILEAGENSVGVRVEIEHTSPTPPGARVTAEARYVGREGKLYLFEVLARDDAGIIGKGRHRRAIVDAKHLEVNAGRRRNPV